MMSLQHIFCTDPNDQIFVSTQNTPEYPNVKGVLEGAIASLHVFIAPPFLLALHNNQTGAISLAAVRF